MTPEVMSKVAADLALGAYDLLLMADGSGTRVDTPCGWYCAAHAPADRYFQEHWGGTSGGTNNYAELAPFLHALWAFHHTFFGASKQTAPPSPLRVVLVSDSEVTVRCGDGQYRRNASPALWAAVDWFAAHNYVLDWRHVRRNTNAVHVEADRRGREVRVLLESYRACDPRPAN